MAENFGHLEKRPASSYFPSADPEGTKLGSGGGIAHLLIEAWKNTGQGLSLQEWLEQSAKLTLLAGGQSRRLPAYAAVSKILIPFKVLRGSLGQRLDQTLLDMQGPDYERLLRQAPTKSVALVASGDVFLRLGSLPPLPQADILALGMWVKPEVAKDFGVFFTRRDRPGELAFFLQKPSVAEIQDLSGTYNYMVDSGMWLLSCRAIELLLRRCGWNGKSFKNGVPDFYELYSDLGLGLGSSARKEDPELRELSTKAVCLPEAEFYHLGTNRQLIEAISTLENRLREKLPTATGSLPHPDQHVQNSHLEFPLRRRENHTLWVENSTIPKGWHLEHEHLLTNIPENDWELKLEEKVCLDFAPIGEKEWCIRAYGMDDQFKGPLNESQWLGRGALEWFAARGIDPVQAGLDMERDIQQCKLFPCIASDSIQAEFVAWLFASKPIPSPQWKKLWVKSPRLSAQEITERINLERLYCQRSENLARSMGRLVANERWDFIFSLDLLATARAFAQTNIPLPPPLPEAHHQFNPMHSNHDRMFRACVDRLRGEADWEDQEALAFFGLQELIVQKSQVAKVFPRCNVMEDQIIWGRSPVRLDLAGGWSDTPPYCLSHGGKVLNLAVNINGQPPVQVFAKLSERPEILLRSIDLGVEERLGSYYDIGAYQHPGSPFSLAKAALALAGFHPKFHATSQYADLPSQLREFGGGIEISLLAAMPKGSGLGTSSILASTLLGVLSELCALGWDRPVLFAQTLALEQLLTTGGGWQDQAGGLYHGIKLIETSPGLEQKPTLRWLPEHLLAGEENRSRVLLFYTGITRMAKSILKEIVRGMFLNSHSHLEIVASISANAEATFHAIQTADWEALCSCIRQSWELNQQLDSGTNPPEVKKILDSVAPHLAAAKLLGAGGGGYLLMFAKTREDAGQIRSILGANPPNSKARFVDFSISETGMQITRS